MKRRCAFIILLFPLFFEGLHVTLFADSKIPAGQDVGAREKDFELQKRYESIKKTLGHQKKKSRIENKNGNRPHFLKKEKQTSEAGGHENTI